MPGQTKSYEVLLVDDDDVIGGHTAEALQCFEFSVRRAYNAADCYAELQKKMPSLVLLDLGLPEISGHEICRHVRQELAPAVPILILSGNQDEADIVHALECGGDDFVSKNTSFPILLAHIRALLRRADAPQQKDSGRLITWGELELDRDANKISLSKKELELTPTEFKLLELFICTPGVVFTRAQLIEKLHGSGHHLTARTMDVHINGIRTQLGGLRDALETVRSVGYRFADAP